MIWLVPRSANLLRRKYRNPHAYARMRDEWSWNLMAAATLNERHALKQFPKTMKRTKIDIHVQHSRLFDRDNLWASVKPILDSMKNLHWITDDSDEEIELQVTQGKAQPDKTVIKLELL